MSLPHASAFNLGGRVAIVTGGSSGLGAAAAAALAGAGAQVVLVARDEARLAQCAERIGASGPKVSWLSGDVTDSVAAEAIVTQAVRDFGALHILVNAAGTIARGPIGDSPDADFEQVMRVNAFGTWTMCRGASRVMSAGAAIVNVSSTAGIAGMTDRSAYAASKGAVSQITKALAVELAPRAIRVNAVAPGPFATDMSSASQTTERWRRLINDRIPLKRVAAAEEIGPPIVFLASDASSFITGVVLAVDGGWSAS
jgi:NAD(P)-dependent dehydrogenase (short-subunit alcohol dehydrogenase family)